MTDGQRLVALEDFRDGKVDFLMATDLAARGLDIKGIETVINYDMPDGYTQYLHRIGRTARAGEIGRSCTFSSEADRKILRQAVKNASVETIFHRSVPPAVVETYRKQIEGLADKIQQVIKEEKEEKLLRQAEMEIQKAESRIKDREEKGKPARTWFKEQGSKL